MQKYCILAARKYLLVKGHNSLQKRVLSYFCLEPAVVLHWLLLLTVCKLLLLHYTATGAANPTAARGGCQTASLLLLQKSNCSVHRSTCATAAQLLLLCTEHYSLVKITNKLLSASATAARRWCTTAVTLAPLLASLCSHPRQSV